MKRILAILVSAAMLLSLMGLYAFAAAPAGEIGSISVEKADGTDGGTFTTFKDAFSIINADESFENCLITCEADKLIPFGGNHISVKRSFTLEGNNSTGITTATSLGEADFAIEFSGVNLEHDTTITLKNFRNGTVWGSRLTDYTLNLVLENCDTDDVNTAYHRIYLNGAKGVTNITLKDCDFTGKASLCTLYSNASGKITVENCTFTDVAEPINLNNKSEGTQTITVKDSSFTDCGLGNTNDVTYAAPVRALVSNANGASAVNVDNCDFVYSNGNEPANGDILIGDGRTGKDSYFVDLSVSNTAAELQIQQPGDRTETENKASKLEIAETEEIELVNVNGTPVPVVPGSNVWDGASEDTSWYDASKKSFVITSAAQLAGLAKLVDNGNTFSGKTVTLATDIDLGDNEWNPVGNNEKQFAGTFDGNGKTISNLYISIPVYGAALFGGVSGTVKNFTVNNADIYNSSLYTAAVVGCGNCTISDVIVKGDVEISGYWYIGGIHGNGYSTVTNCHVNANAGSSISSTNGAYVGGIKGFSGENGCKTINCSVKNLDLSALTYVGGIQGILHYENIAENCYVENVNVTVIITPEDAGADQHDVFCGGLLAGNTSNAAYKNAYASVKNFSYASSKVIFGDGTESNQLVGLERNNKESDTIGAFVGGTSYSDIDEAIKAAKTIGEEIVLYENFKEDEITEDIAGVKFTSVGTKDYTLESNSADLIFCEYTDGSTMYVNKTDITANATLRFLPTENERVFDIAIEADKGTYLNRLSNIDLTFTNANTDYSYEILAREDGFVAVNGVPGNDNRYEFHFNGTDKASENGAYVIMGQVKFGGYSEDEVDFSASADTNAAQAAEIADNIVRSYYPEGSVDYDAAKTGKFIDDAKIEGIVYEEATTEVKVVIEFNNNITAGNTAFYNDMTVTLTGANGKVYTGKVGNDADTAEVNYEDGKDLVTFVFPEVVVGENGYYYTATVKGAGYRNATLTKRLTADSADKTYLFWNNVKDVEGDSFLAGDIVKDNIINIYDLSAVVSYFGEEDLQNANPGYAKYDLNRDGKIDSKDVAYVLVSWNK